MKDQTMSDLAGTPALSYIMPQMAAPQGAALIVSAGEKP